MAMMARRCQANLLNRAEWIATLDAKAHERGSVIEILCEHHCCTKGMTNDWTSFPTQAFSDQVAT